MQLLTTRMFLSVRSLEGLQQASLRAFWVGLVPLGVILAPSLLPLLVLMWVWLQVTQLPVLPGEALLAVV
ncbi:MAG: hypothetical protein HY694_01770 [Deltaproteobacteria bacterium]|nr:hypothetical protein [Deltaproteobacteria bacterium]